MHVSDMKRLVKYFTITASAFMLPSCLVIDGEFDESDIIFFSILFLIIAGAVIRGIRNKIRIRKENKYWALYAEKEREKKRAAKELADRKHSQYLLERQSLAELKGEPDKTIQIGTDEVSNEIRAYAERKVVSILGKDYDFSSILQCYASDNSYVENGSTVIKSSGTSSVNSDSLFRRAVVGGLIGGETGAVIGGSTASRDIATTSVVRRGNDVTHHDYTVWISVKDISEPLIQIPIGEDEVKANEVVSLMNAIIASV